jgi:hypothetical protein
VQIQIWRWGTLRSAAALCPSNLLQAFRRARRYWVKADPVVNEWEWYLPLFTGSHLVMRSKINGEWQYRSPTPEEEADYVASAIW